jgi:xanthine/uracil permease
VASLINWVRKLFPAVVSGVVIIAVGIEIALFAMSGVALFSSGNLSRGEGEDRANRWVIVPLALIGLHDAPTQLELFEIARPRCARDTDSG